MLKLSIMSEEELTHIFGDLDAYIPLHEDLLAQLARATGPDGTVGQIGQIVVSWVRTRSCAHSTLASLFLYLYKYLSSRDQRVEDVIKMPLYDMTSVCLSSSEWPKC